MCVECVNSLYITYEFMAFSGNGRWCIGIEKVQMTATKLVIAIKYLGTNKKTSETEFTNVTVHQSL